MKEKKNYNVDASARVIILRSTTPGIFCAGADLKVSREVTPGKGEDFQIKIIGAVIKNFL